MDKATGSTSWTGTWLIVGALLGMLAFSVALLNAAANLGRSDPAAAMPGGYVAMTLGIMAIFALSAGLMTLMYCTRYQNRGLSNPAAR
jgi:hypothetical protein